MRGKRREKRVTAVSSIPDAEGAISSGVAAQCC